MDIFKVESNRVAYDEDDSMIIIADCHERALELAKENWVFREGHQHIEFAIEKVSLNKEQIVVISHYGD